MQLGVNWLARLGLTGVLLTAAPAPEPPQPPPVPVDWPRFLAAQDMAYDRLPDAWGNGAFTGNGLVGANVFSTDKGTTLGRRIGRTDVTFRGNRIPIGEWRLSVPGGLHGGTGRLNLWDATFNATPWPKIWWNLNLQLTYWPIITANRLELGEPLVALLDHGAANLATNAAPFAGDSAAIGGNSPYDCVSHAALSTEMSDLPWALHDECLPYRAGMDPDLLRNHLFPLLRRAVNFNLHQLKPDARANST